MKAEWQRLPYSQYLIVGPFVGFIDQAGKVWVWRAKGGGGDIEKWWRSRSEAAAKARAEAALDAMIAELAAARGYKLVKEGDA